MRSFHEIPPLRTFLHESRVLGKTIGLVPTMGALHDGHLSLIRTSKNDADITVASIFVNPTQFNNQADFEQYPTRIAEDLELLQSSGCDAVFIPSKEMMYPSDPMVSISFGTLESEMEGTHRPGHFQGVGLIVSKLLNIVQPSFAYFGQKDLQQCAIVRQLVQDMQFPVEIKIVPTIRESSGLAMSSRNLRLSASERSSAAILFKVLQQSAKMLSQEFDVDLVTKFAENEIKKSSVINLEYFRIVDSRTMQSLHRTSSSNTVALCVAAYVGDVRLIDNVILHETDEY